MFSEETTFTSLSIRTSTKALHNAFNINYKAGLKQGIDLRVRGPFLESPKKHSPRKAVAKSQTFSALFLRCTRDLKGCDDDDDDQVSDLINDAGNQDSRKGIFAYAITSKNFQILNIIVSCDSVG